MTWDNNRNMKKKKKKVIRDSQVLSVKIVSAASRVEVLEFH